jgi:type IV pilus assembly protein PilB
MEYYPSRPSNVTTEMETEAHTAGRRAHGERLGDLLVAAGVITKEQLHEALAVQRARRRRLGRVLVEMGMATEEQIVSALAVQLGVERVHLSDHAPDPEVSRLIPHAVAKRHMILPLRRHAGRLRVAMSNPLDVVGIDYVRARAGCPVDTLIATETEVSRAIEASYGEMTSGWSFTENIERAVQEYEGKIGVPEDDEETSIEGAASEAPIIDMVNAIMIQAVRARATDIHVEPGRADVRIRYRIDGLLRTAKTLPRSVLAAMISRIKIMADMDITEKRVPQDGRIGLLVAGSELNIRVSSMPSQWGEGGVLRILPKSGRAPKLSELGFGPELQSRLELLLTHPYGIILATGPTGSGKTTTLYAALSYLCDETRKIITVEDPIEYELEGISQTQVNSRIGVTFASQLRSILRQDPDVIFVGEIRDSETAEMALRASLTGHLVLTTLHTNDAPRAITRLIDIGTLPFMVGATVLGVISQRLVRRVCRDCKQPYQPDPELLQQVGIEEKPGEVFVRGSGCEKCDNSGFLGRMAVCELLEMTDELRVMLGTSTTSTDWAAAAPRFTIRTMRDDAIDKVFAGQTTVEELVRAGIVMRAWSESAQPD